MFDSFYSCFVYSSSSFSSSLFHSYIKGGLTMKEESCIVLMLYYPRQNKLTTCHSLPSLPTVLHSLGIEQLATDSNPVLISAPPELAGMTLEVRLLSYDWRNQFNEFQEATRKGSFKPLCWGVKNRVVPVSINLKNLKRKSIHHTSLKKT
uniref:Uncharacterized protein n=1 Tax=Glossina palpalis gambiensis TaxID=67801 RepID=A0A1B0C4H4_9MUSC